MRQAAGKVHGWCCCLCCPSCCSCYCWRRSAAQRDIQTEREPAIKKYSYRCYPVTLEPIHPPSLPLDVAAYAPAQVPPTPNRAPLPPSFLRAPFQLLISINDKHIAKALWAPRPCPRNAYIIYIRITINVVPQRRKREGDEEADVAKQKTKIETKKKPEEKRRNIAKHPKS